ncbi:MAG: DUF6481 family protein [Hyphomicrobiaceae bacterium]
MRQLKGQSLADRQQNARKAKEALLQKMREAPKPDDPEVVARREAKAATLAANRAERERRRAEKAAAERAEAERLAALQAAEFAEAERKKNEEAEKIKALLAEQKAARDARYAARKKRRG